MMPPEGAYVLGLVEMGDDEQGQPRLVIATTREAIRGHARNLVFKPVRVSLAAPPGATVKTEEIAHG